VRRINIHLPRQVGRRAIEFLVEEVTPATNGLTQREARRADVNPFSETNQWIAADIDIQRDQTAHDRSGNTKAAIANINSIQRMRQIKSCSISLRDGRGRRSKDMPQARPDPTTTDEAN